MSLLNLSGVTQITIRKRDADDAWTTIRVDYKDAWENPHIAEITLFDYDEDYAGNPIRPKIVVEQDETFKKECPHCKEVSLPVTGGECEECHWETW